MKKRILAVLIMIVLLLPLSASAAEPALSFSPPEKGLIIFLGKDDTHSSLRWRVLDTDENRILLITRNTANISTDWYDRQYPFVSMDYVDNFEDGNYPKLSRWDKSQIRALCSKMYQDWVYSAGVHKQEAQALIPCTVEETENYRAGRFDLECEPVSLNGEPIFVLSAKEAEQYFDSEADRACTDADGAPTWWWLRSPVRHSSIYLDSAYIICCVDDAGWLNSFDVLQSYNYPLAGFRPSCQLDPKRVLFINAVKDGKPKLAQDAAMAPVAAGDYEDWKLTLLMPGWQFSADTAPLAAKPGENSVIQYTGAKIGSKYAISVIICDREGTPLYYGSLKSSKLVDGTAEFPVPAKLAPGEYTVKVFNEERNDNRNSDLASGFTDIPLTVR